jgi:phosphoserine phosphatase RsbU/P
MTRKKSNRKPSSTSAISTGGQGVSPRSPAPDAQPRLDLSRIRHDLRTPINHIIGYCEMLQEAEDTPTAFQPDLQKIHAGGRQLLTLITEYFNEETFESRRQDLQRLCHELRTPVNHIIGYGELLHDEAEQQHARKLIPDLQRITQAARTWLALMEEYLLPQPAANAGAPHRADAVPEAGFGFIQPTARSSAPAASMSGRLLVVDDDDANREMLARRLARHGFEVVTASNGLDALQLIRTSKFDLVLLDMVMPRLDGYQVLSRIKSQPALADLPVIMISALDEENGVARCIELGAEDYLSKPFNPVFLRARIGACLEKRRLRERERVAFEALEQSQKILSAELAEAAGYVRSLLPAPLTTGPVRADWRFQPSTQLGGDAFSYRWLDEKHFAFFLLDVSGHGVGAALLSVSVLNTLQNRSMPGVDFRDPGAVLAGLNGTFTAERQNNMFFTIWYGVLAIEKREVAFACGGHPPAILLPPESSVPQSLSAPGAIVGGFPEVAYATRRAALPPGSRIYLFSDGIYELARPDGSTVQLDEFASEAAKPASGVKLDDLLAWAARIRGDTKFEDDISIIELRLA